LHNARLDYKNRHDPFVSWEPRAPPTCHFLGPRRNPTRKTGSGSKCVLSWYRPQCRSWCKAERKVTSQSSTVCLQALIVRTDKQAVHVARITEIRTACTILIETSQSRDICKTWESMEKYSVCLVTKSNDFLHYLGGSRDISLGMEKRLWAGQQRGRTSSPGMGKRFFYSPQHPEQFCTQSPVHCVLKPLEVRNKALRT
jgi:hypothetical protein